MATDTMAEFMGVRVDPVDDAVTGDLQTLTADVTVAGTVGQGGAAYVFDGRLNDSFRALNMLLDESVAVRRADRASPGVRPGDFVVSAGSESSLAAVAKDTGVSFAPLKAAPTDGTHETRRQRIGLYQRYLGGNMDEGWTRWLLEQWGFPFTSLMDAEIRKGDLNARYDVIVFADDSTATITGERPAGAGAGGRGGGPSLESVPPDYRSGIGREGVEALRTFVQKGGTLVTLGGASNFAIERFGLPVRNVVGGAATKDFYSPGSTLHAIFDPAHPLAYGMPSEGLLLFWNSMAFEIAPTDANENYQVVARFPERDLLESGWLIGERLIAKKAALVSAKHGDGRIVLFAFRPQARAQTHGTFKLLFNALVE